MSRKGKWGEEGKGGKGEKEETKRKDSYKALLGK